MESVPVPHEVPTITANTPTKEQLLARFLIARDTVGLNWRRKLAESDPYFDSLDGANDMKLTAEASHEGRRRGQVDRIKRVVLGLEKVAGIPHAPIL